MAKNNVVVKIFAFLALFWIFASIVATWILFIFSSNEPKSISKEKIEELVKQYKLNNTWSISDDNNIIINKENIGSWDTNTWTIN